MNEHITVVGTIATIPERRETATGLPIAGFRVACNRTRLDRASGTWVDDGTSWYDVSAYRGLAENALASLHKGERVIVSGRLKLREWEANGKRGVAAQLDADAMGHDLLWGTSAYRKTAGAAPVSAGAATVPAGAPSAGVDANGWAQPGGDTQTTQWSTAVPGSALPADAGQRAQTPAHAIGLAGGAVATAAEADRLSGGTAPVAAAMAVEHPEAEPVPF